MGVFMINPTKPGTYTTIFKDGSIVLYNQWLTFDNPNLNKWYFNEEYRGGVIHWFKPEENYQITKYYKVPRHILYELVETELFHEAYFQYFDLMELQAASYKYCEENQASFEDLTERYIEKYFKDYEIIN